jgi:hypothetical protein
MTAGAVHPPPVPNTTDANRFKNRRVELKRNNCQLFRGGQTVKYLTVPAQERNFRGSGKTLAPGLAGKLCK